MRVRDAVTILRERGVTNFVAEALDFVNYKLRHLVYRLSGAVWRIRGGHQQFSIGGVSATFDADPSAGGTTVRWRVNNEYEMLSDLVGRLGPDDVFYDVGASLGVQSAFAARRVSDGGVVAFEPHGENFTRLERNLSHNDADARTFRVALSDSSGEVAFDREAESLAVDGQGDREGADVVQAVEGDEFIARESLPHPTVVKVDVEGAELRVLKGLEDALADERCRAVYCEIHLPADHRESVRSHGGSGAELLGYLSELGFSIRILDTRGAEIQVVGEK